MERTEKLKAEMIEKMKRKGQALVGEQVELLVRIPVTELNAPQTAASTRATLIETESKSRD
jgi:hypothetical protein